MTQMSSDCCKCGHTRTPEGESGAHTESTAALVKAWLLYITQSHEKPLGQRRAGEGQKHTTAVHLQQNSKDIAPWCLDASTHWLISGNVCCHSQGVGDTDTQ